MYQMHNIWLAERDVVKRIFPKITNGSDNRNPLSYRNVLLQFEVEVNPRYTPRAGKTYCNIYNWDVSRAMGVEIPHFDIFYVKGPNSQGMLTGHEHNANEVIGWLNDEGVGRGGWIRLTDSALAVEYAKLGKPTVIAWLNPKGPGHLGWVVPSDEPGIRIAQAGARNFFDRDYTEGFGNVKPIWFYSHD